MTTWPKHEPDTEGTRVVGRIQFNDHASLYRLNNGLIVHREDASALNGGGDYRYTVCLPGASDRGCAKTLNWARTLRGALELAALSLKKPPAPETRTPHD